MVLLYKTNRLSTRRFSFYTKGFTFRLTFFFCFIEPLPLNYHIKYNIRPYQKWLENIQESLKPKCLDSVWEHILLRDFHYVCYRVWDEMNKNERRVLKNKVKRYFLQFFGVFFWWMFVNVHGKKGIIKILVSICGLLGFVCG